MAGDMLVESYIALWKTRRGFYVCDAGFVAHAERLGQQLPAINDEFVPVAPNRTDRLLSVYPQECPAGKAKTRRYACPCALLAAGSALTISAMSSRAGRSQAITS